MITREAFERIVELMGDQAKEDIAWAQDIKAPEDADDFALEAIFVICNSGMKNTVARGIYERVATALDRGVSASTAFGHTGKTAAIDTIWRDREALYQSWLEAEDKLANVAALPFIGSITKWHLAKNFGMDVVKPDVHMVRLAKAHNTTPEELCANLARETGFRVATIDTVLWRACANGVLDGHTGEIRGRFI